MSVKTIHSTSTQTSTTSSIQDINVKDFTIQVTVVASSGNVTASVVPYVSLDGVAWVALTTITIGSAATPQAAKLAVTENWRFLKVTGEHTGTNSILTVSICG